MMWYILGHKRVGGQELLAAIRHETESNCCTGDAWEIEERADDIHIVLWHDHQRNPTCECGGRKYRCVLPKGDDGLYGARELAAAHWPNAIVSYNYQQEKRQWKSSGIGQHVVADALLALGCCEKGESDFWRPGENRPRGPIC